jgi:pimeloyl-ACP methyl ester carboxylesterase
MNYLLISGNPPATYFYERWREEIMVLQPGSKALVSPYPVLSRMADSSKAMDKILATHLDQLDDFSEKSGAPITLIGHSLGGHFAMRLLEKASDKIQKVILIHPTLREPRLRGRIILRTLTAFYPSDHLQKLFLRLRNQLEFFSDELSFLTDEEILKTFHLIRHEDATVARDRSPLVLAPQDCSKVVVFYNRSDIWTHPKVVDALKSQVPIFECLEPHDFITQEIHRRSLFAKILKSSLAD